MEVASFALNSNYNSEHRRTTNTSNALKGEATDQNVSGSSDNSQMGANINIPSKIETSVPKSQSNFTIEQIRQVYLTRLNSNSVNTNGKRLPNEEVFEQKYMRKHMVSFLRTVSKDEDIYNNAINQLPMCVGLATVNRLLSEQIFSEQDKLEFFLYYRLYSNNVNHKSPRLLSPWNDFLFKNRSNLERNNQNRPKLIEALETLATWKLDGVLQASDILEYHKGRTPCVTLNTVIFGQCFLINDPLSVTSKNQDEIKSVAQIQSQSYAINYYAKKLRTGAADSQEQKDMTVRHIYEILNPPSVSESVHSFDAKPTYGDSVFLVIKVVEVPQSESAQNKYRIQYEPYTQRRLYTEILEKKKDRQKNYIDEELELLYDLNIIGVYSVGKITDESATGRLDSFELLRICVDPKFIHYKTLVRMFDINPT